MERKTIITKGIANDSYFFTRVYQPYATDKVWPIGCTTTHAFIVLEDQNQKTFRLAILKISPEIFKTPYACDVINKGVVPYEQPWNLVPNHFTEYKAACAFSQYVCIFMARQFCVFSGNGMVRYRFQQDFHTVHCCDMNDQYLVVSYETEDKVPMFAIYNFTYPNNCSLYHETKWPSIISYCSLSKALAPNSTYIKHLVFFTDSKENVSFKVWDILEEEECFAPNPNVDQQVTLDDTYGSISLFVQAFNHNLLIVQATPREMFMYNPTSFSENYPTPKFPMANAFYWADHDILIAHDCLNNLHFLNFGKKTILIQDLADDAYYEADVDPESHCEFLGMLREEIINAPSHTVQEDTPRPLFPYKSLMTIGEKAIGFLLPDGTFTVIQPLIPEKSI